MKNRLYIKELSNRSFLPSSLGDQSASRMSYFSFEEQKFPIFKALNLKKPNFSQPVSILARVRLWRRRRSFGIEIHIFHPFGIQRQQNAVEIRCGNVFRNSYFAQEELFI